MPIRPNTAETMLMQALIILLLMCTLAPWGVAAPGSEQEKAVDIQLFGDLYIPAHVLAATQSSSSDPRLLRDVAGLLASARYNVVNFEGTTTESFIPNQFKRYHLKMAPTVASLLVKAGIHVATLANNHTVDFGTFGLLETIARLRQVGLFVTGAGKNLAEATTPLILPTATRSICLLAFSRTLPQGFWAEKARAGTAFLGYEKTHRAVKACADRGHYTIVSFHWGQELARHVKAYQRELAQVVISAGANVVIGHHPHVLQEIEVINGSPVFYSIGNFAFGSMPQSGDQEGLGVRIELLAGTDKARYEIVPLEVRNDRVNFVPRPLISGEKPPAVVRSFVDTTDACAWDEKKRHAVCLF